MPSDTTIAPAARLSWGQGCQDRPQQRRGGALIRIVETRNKLVQEEGEGMDG